MAVQLTGSAGLSGQFQKYFNPKLLDHAINTLVLNQFALTAPLPREKGATTIRFTRQDIALSSNVQTLVEGTPISTFRDTTLTFIDAPLQLFGQAGRYSDLLSYTELFNVLEIQHVQFAEDFALKCDDVILNAVIPNVTGVTKRYSQQITSWANLAAATAQGGAFVVADALDAFTALQDQLAPKIGGEYIMIVPPRVARDCMNDAKFITAGQYGTNKGLFNGEIGRLYDVRFVVSTNAWFEDGTAGAENTRVTTGHGAKDIYASIATGRSAYGVPALAGMSYKSPSIIIVNTPDSLNPLNQYTTMGWKAYYTSILLNGTFCSVVRSRSTFQ